MKKFGAGTTTVTVALCDRDPEVPVRVSTYSPGRMVDDTTIVREENADEAGVRLRTEGLNEKVKPCGEITDRATAPVKLKLVATTENAPCWPKSMTTLTGPDSAKSTGGFGGMTVRRTVFDHLRPLLSVILRVTEYFPAY